MGGGSSALGLGLSFAPSRPHHLRNCSSSAGWLAGALRVHVSDTGEYMLPFFFPPAINDSCSLLHRTSDVVPNQLKKLHGRHQFCACMCACVREGGRGDGSCPAERRAPSGVSIRAALLISDSLCSTAGLAVGGEESHLRGGITPGRNKCVYIHICVYMHMCICDINCLCVYMCIYMVPHKNHASVTKRNQKVEI